MSEGDVCASIQQVAREFEPAVARWELQCELGAGHEPLCLQKNETACLASRMRSSLIAIVNGSPPGLLYAGMGITHGFGSLTRLLGVTSVARKSCPSGWYRRHV